MGLLQQLRAWWLFNGTSNHRSRIYLVDMSAIVAGKRNASRPGPGELVQALKRLARFAGKEQIKMVALATGKPLREVADGGTLDGIRVFFAESPENFPGLALKRVKQELRNQNVMVITSDRKLEEQVTRAGGQIMRGSTFRKALDAVAGGGSSSSRGGNSGESRGRRPRRRRPSGKGKPQGNAPKKDDDPVNELLDVVE